MIQGTMNVIIIESIWFRTTADRDEHKNNLNNHIITKTCEPHVRFFILVRDIRDIKKNTQNIST